MIPQGYSSKCMARSSRQKKLWHQHPPEGFDRKLAGYLFCTYLERLTRRTCGHLHYILVGASSTKKRFFFSLAPSYLSSSTFIQDHRNNDMADNKVDLTPTANPTLVLDEDTPGPPMSVPEEPADAGEGGKLKMIVQLVKNCLGVKDIAAMCVLHNHHCFSHSH